MYFAFGIDGRHGSPYNLRLGGFRSKSWALRAVVRHGRGHVRNEKNELLLVVDGMTVRTAAEERERIAEQYLRKLLHSGR